VAGIINAITVFIFEWPHLEGSSFKKRMLQDSIWPVEFSKAGIALRMIAKHEIEQSVTHFGRDASGVRNICALMMASLGMCISLGLETGTWNNFNSINEVQIEPNL
jgi:hypothetical protein